MPPPDDPRVDELRQRLRSLGYLDAGVDRFVLAPAREARRPAAIALLSSVRIGALSAVMLGPAAAIGLRARLPDLVTGARDAIVVAAYLAVFFGLAAAAAAFGAGLLAPLVSRRLTGSPAARASRVSRVIGIVVTAACLAYLTLWWRAVIVDVGRTAPLWSFFALAVAATISLVLGHAVSIVSAGVIGAADGTIASAPRSSWRASLLGGAAAVGAAALLLTWSTRGAPAEETPPLTVVSSGQRLRVFAIDGFDARLFDELAAAGRVPALAAAMRGAVLRFADDAGTGTRAPDPARVWTTIATGQPVQVHGVHGLETRRLAGLQGSLHAGDESRSARLLRGATDLLRLTRPALASGDERRARTFWEVAAQAGLRTAVVNWWATWPARGDAGTVITDRATLRLEQGGALDAELSPAALYDDLRRQWPEIVARAAERAESALPSSSDDARAVLERSARLDALQLTLVERVAAPGIDLSVVYLPGLDIVQHALLGDAAAAGASTLATRLAAVQRYYEALDRLLAADLAPRDREIVAVITEPGRVQDRQGARLSMTGGIAAPGERAGASTSVAPTLLYALGVPVSRDRPSPPALELFAPDFVSRYPVRSVDTYGPPSRTPAVRSGQPLDQEMIDRLRSLGYVR